MPATLSLGDMVPSIDLYNPFDDPLHLGHDLARFLDLLRRESLLEQFVCVLDGEAQQAEDELEDLTEIAPVHRHNDVLVLDLAEQPSLRTILDVLERVVSFLKPFATDFQAVLMSCSGFFATVSHAASAFAPTVCRSSGGSLKMCKTKLKAALTATKGPCH